MDRASMSRDHSRSGGGEGMLQVDGRIKNRLLCEAGVRK